MPDATKTRRLNAVKQRTDPMQLRAVFGANLRALSADAPSIAALCRDLEINRTQFNRYLAGEAFPRPDVLHQICGFFKVDARILLEPLETTNASAGRFLRGQGRLGDRDIQPFNHGIAIDYSRMPLGASLIYRRSFLNFDELSISMTMTVVKPDGSVGLMTIMPQEVAQYLGMSVQLKDRRRNGQMYQHPTGVSFAFKGESSPVWQFAFVEYSYLGNPNLYAGECLNTLRLGHPGRITDRILVERLDPTRVAMFAARRHTGYKRITDMKPAIQGYFTHNEL